MVSLFSFSILKLLYTPLSPTTSNTIPVLDSIISQDILKWLVPWVALVTAQPLTGHPDLVTNLAGLQPVSNKLLFFTKNPPWNERFFSPWKWMVGKWSFPFWVSAHFQGPAVSFREGNIIQLLDKNIERLFNWFLHQCRLSIPKGQWCYHIYISQNMRIDFPIQFMYGIFPYIWLIF